MSGCTPAPAILALLQQVNAAFPSRSRASDGICGDARHQASVSDHNQGNAVDITLDAANGPDLEELARVLLQDPRCAYVIFRTRIANPDKVGGAWRPYKGANAHNHHLHLSIRAPRRNDASPWKLPEPPTFAPIGAEILGGRRLSVDALPLGLGMLAVLAAGGVLLMNGRQKAPERRVIDLRRKDGK